MKDESILMKKIQVEGQTFYFGHLLFSVDHIDKINISKFKRVDEKIEAMKYICLTIHAMNFHKKQKEACQSLWDYINKERKKDSRITKEILKVWPDGLGDNIFSYYERKERKFIPKSSRQLSKKYLLTLCLNLKELKYKIDDAEYQEQRAIIYQAILNLLKTRSEYGFVPVLVHRSMDIIKTFYPYYPEVLQLPVSEQNTKLAFITLLEIWELSKDVEILKTINRMFDLLKLKESKDVISNYYEKVLNIVREQPELEIYLPQIMRFKKLEAEIVWKKEDSLMSLAVEVDVLQKMAMDSQRDNLNAQYFLQDLMFLLSYELEDLEIVKPLRAIYLKKDKSEIEFCFTKSMIENVDLFNDTWKKVVEEVMQLKIDSEENKRGVVSIMNEDYLMRLNVKPTTEKTKIIKY